MAKFGALGTLRGVLLSMTCYITLSVWNLVLTLVGLLLFFCQIWVLALIFNTLIDHTACTIINNIHFKKALNCKGSWRYQNMVPKSNEITDLKLRYQDEKKEILKAVHKVLKSGKLVLSDSNLKSNNFVI